jgi:long-chain acyl-CoA synthetase
MAALATDAAALHGDRTALRYKGDDSWVDESYADLGRISSEIARGLMALGIEPGDKVAILSNTRPEWTSADLGILSAGATLAPVYQTNSPDECQYVLEHSEARAAFCEDASQLAKVEQVRTQCPRLDHLIAFEDAGPGGSISLDELRARGKDVSQDELDARVRGVGDDDICVYIYTSGTTGPPKACMLTHANYRANIDMVRAGYPAGADDVFYAFLPLAHALTRLLQMYVLDLGATLAYWQRDMRQVPADLGEVKPTQLPSVPRLYEKIYTTANAAVAEAGGLKARIFHWAIATGRRVRALERRGGRPGPLLRLQYRLADRQVLSKVRALFGGRLQYPVTGAAPIAPEILEFFDACGVTVLEGYGMTECTAVTAINTPDTLRFGTVGKALPGSELRIADDGEVLMRGPHVFKGYFKDEPATREAVVDGWLHSGDLGSLDTDGFLTITGRKKDLIITSSGKNITPTNIENALKQHRWISQAVVYGDRRSYLVALITLDPDEAPKLAEQVGADADPVKLAEHPGVRAEIQTVVDEVNERFARIEQVKAFTILDRDLSQAEGELTPTTKVKRAVVYEKYGDAFDRLYAESAPPRLIDRRPT